MHARTYIFDIVGVHLTMFCNVLLLSFALSFAVMVRFFHLLFWILNLIYVSPFSIMCMHTRAPQNICGCNGAEYLVGWLVHRMDVSYATLQFLLGAIPSNWCYFIPLYVQPIYLPCTFHMRWMGQMGGWNSREQTWWPHLKNNKQETLGLWCHFFCSIPCSLCTAHKRWVFLHTNAWSIIYGRVCSGDGYYCLHTVHAQRTHLCSPNSYSSR